MRKRAAVAVVLALVATLWAASARDPAAPQARRRDAIALAAHAAAMLPVAFQPNRGQGSPGDRYVARGAGYAIALRDGQVLLGVRAAHRRRGVVGIALTGGRRARPRAERPLRGRVSYLRGRDPRRWIRDVPTYGAVRYRRVWPGIDARFHGDARHVEFDFDVAPGADVGQVGLAISGARALRVDRGGALRIGLPGGAIRLLPPRSYQRRGTRRIPVHSRFVLGRRGHVGVRVGEYDRHATLVVDPSIDYSTYIGGTGTDQGLAVAAGSGGNAYVAGVASDGFPNTNHGFGGAGDDAFVTKIDPTKTGAASLLWSTVIGGSGDDQADAIAVNANGAAFVGGFTESSNFPVQNAYQATFHGPRDAFVARLNTAGDGLTYATYFGATSGSVSENVAAIAVDANNRAYLGGSTVSASSFPTKGVQLPPTGPFAAFFSVLSADGSALVYSSPFGGNGANGTAGVAVADDGTAFLTGTTSSSDFPVTAGAYEDGSGQDFTKGTLAFVMHVDPVLSGTALKWSTLLGGPISTYPSGAEGHAIAVDANGHAFVAGLARHAFPTTSGAFQRGSGGDDADGFVTKLNAAGSDLLWSTRLKGSGDDSAEAIAVDGSGLATVVGSTSSTDFPTGGHAPQAALSGPSDAFVTRLNASGSGTVFSTYLGGTEADSGAGVALDPDGNTLVTGTNSYGSFPVVGGFQAASAGGPQFAFGTGEEDAFFAKLVRFTSLSLSCAPAAIVIAQPTTCTATVTDSNADSDIPTGTVRFGASGSGTFGGSGRCTLDAGSAPGTATCALAFTPSDNGGQTITATYAGDATHGTSTGTDTISVQRRQTQVSVACTPDPATVGQASTCTAGVADTALGTASTPTGSVSFEQSGGAGAFSAGACTLSSGSCSVTYTPTTTATATITATYAGDTTHAGSTAPTTLGVLARATFTVVSCAPSTLDARSATSCTATVTDAAPGTASTPTGTVTAAVVAGAGALAASPCTLATTGPATAACTFSYTPALPATGTHTLRGSYGGDATHGTSAGTTSLTVNGRPTTTVLSCDPAAGPVGVPVTCTATVADAGQTGGASPPTGSVSLATGGSGALSSASCTLDAAGRCTIAYTPAAAGTDTLTASFPGDVIHLASTGTTQVAAVARATTLALDCAPGSFVLGATTTCTATVADAGDTATAVAPAGSVALTTSGAGLAAASCTLVAGAATSSACAVDDIPATVGTDTITATYAGSPVHAAAVPARADVTIAARPVPPPPPAPVAVAPASIAETVVLGCEGLSIRLLDVEASGRRVRVAGLALARFAGEHVTISAGGKALGTATVGTDGTFSAVVAASSRRYTASVAGAVSAALQLSRRLTLGAVRAGMGGARITGRLVSDRGAHRPLTITRQVGCAHSSAVAATRTDARGRFSVVVPRPTGTDPLAVYRVKTSSGGKTYTLPVLVRR